MRRFRYGVQVNSLGLTEQQPENNVYRILFGMLGVTLSKDARARAVQLPAWNEALGLPRPWDQQWSLRLQQIAAFETDMLEYGDIFEGSTVIGEKVETLKAQMRGEIARIADLGGAGTQDALEYMKERLVRSNAARIEAIETGAETRVGVNAYTGTETSPLTAGSGHFVTVDEKAEARTDRTAQGLAFATRPQGSSRPRSPISNARQRKNRTSCRPRSPARRRASRRANGPAICAASMANIARPRAWRPTGPVRNDERIMALRDDVDAASRKLGRKFTFLVAKPGLDGHSNGAEQIAIRARDAGMDVIYDGIRFTADEIVAVARAKKPHVIGLSILSGSHVPLAADVVAKLKAAGLGDVKVVAGGIIPAEDAARLEAGGVAAVFSPKDYDLNEIMTGIVDLTVP